MHASLHKLIVYILLLGAFFDVLRTLNLFCLLDELIRGIGDMSSEHCRPSSGKPSVGVWSPYCRSTAHSPTCVKIPLGSSIELQYRDATNDRDALPSFLLIAVACEATHGVKNVTNLRHRSNTAVPHLPIKLSSQSQNCQARLDRCLL
jgi:hypothetical protein